MKLLVLVFVMLASCGPGTREKTLSTTLASVNGARDGFLAYDEIRQEKIIAQATSLEDGKARLTAYRTARQHVEDSFNLVYRLLAVAAINKDTPLTHIIQLVVDVVAAVDKLKEGE